MTHFDTEYQRLEASYNDSPPGEENLMVHVAEGSKSPHWHHIENLDLFFSRVYNLHQKNGFTCMLISEIFELMQFIFVVAFTTFLVSCVDYDILFANKLVNHSQHSSDPVKVTLPDAFLPPNECSARIQANGFLLSILVIAGVFWIHRLIKFIYNICCYWEIHSFYVNALKIPMFKRKLTEVPWETYKRFWNYMLVKWSRSLYTRHVKHKARGPDVARKVVSCGLRSHPGNIQFALLYLAGGTSTDYTNPKGAPDLHS